MRVLPTVTVNLDDNSLNENTISGYNCSYTSYYLMITTHIDNQWLDQAYLICTDQQACAGFVRLLGIHT